MLRPCLRVGLVQNLLLRLGGEFTVPNVPELILMAPLLLLHRGDQLAELLCPISPPAPTITTNTDYIYRLASSTPDTPTGGNSDSSHTPTGWQQTQPSPTNTQGVYRSKRTRRYSNNRFTSATDWTDPTRISEPTTPPVVIRTDTDYVYRTSVATPDTPTGGTTTEVHTPSNWSRNQPSATETEAVYSSSRTRTYRNSIFSSATAWADPVKIEDKLPVATVVTTDIDYVYIRAASLPDVPTGGTNELNHTPVNWSRSQSSAIVGQGVYRASRTLTYVNDVFSSATVWGTVTRVTAPIEPPTITTDVDYIYILATSLPGVPTAGVSEEIYTPSGGWTSAQPSPTLTHGVYQASRTRIFTNGEFDFSTAWRNIIRIAAPVTAPTITTDVEYIYLLASNTPASPVGGTSIETHTPSGWSRVQLSPTNANGVYRASRTRTHTDGTFTSATIWGDVTKIADPTIPEVITTDVDYVYRLSAALPSAPTGGTDVVEHTPNNWSRTQPSATTQAGVYQASRSRTFTDDVFTLATLWGDITLVSNPVVAPTITTNVDYIYILSSSLPSVPNTGTTTEVHTPNNWSRVEPNPTNTQGVYRSHRTRTYSDGTFVSATNWFVPSRTYGPVAPTSISITDFDYVYRLAATIPATPLGGLGEENYSPLEWGRGKPSVTATLGVWRSRRTRVYVNGIFSSGGVWLTPVEIEEPETSAEVSTHEIDTIYRLAASSPTSPTEGVDIKDFTPSDWGRTEPEPTEAQNVYSTERVLSYVNGSFVSAGMWGNVVRVMRSLSQQDDELSSGDEVFIESVVGMTELNGRRFRVIGFDSDSLTFDLEGIDSSDYGDYVDGGFVYLTFVALLESNRDTPINEVEWKVS